MPTPRKSQISLADTPYYHCISRCVRRAFLCGEDKVSGKSFEHRRSWVEEKLLFLGTVFAIDICAYAVMSNHTHIVLFIDDKLAKNWSVQEVLMRWHKLFKGTFITREYIEKGESSLGPEELITLNETANVYRKRLMDISWFMRVLNEDIARRANKEDRCTGRFWEGRFKTQPLLDEAALVACMAYVDLNPIRAKMAPTPESSKYTSIRRRIESALEIKQPKELVPFVGNPRIDMPNGLPFNITDYIKLIEETGRLVREDKRGFIEPNQLNILTRLNISQEQWLVMTTEFMMVFHGAVGNEKSLGKYHKRFKRKRRTNLSICKKLLD